MKFRIQHSSLQFSDSPAQQRHDIQKLFARGAEVMTWTEASPDNANYRLVKEIGPHYGYEVFAAGAGVGVAVKKTFGKIIAKDFLKVADGIAHQYSNRGIAWVTIDVKNSPEVITVGAVHYVTKGRTREDGARYWINRKFASVIGAFTKRKAPGRKLGFVAGDFNIIDRVQDVFFGQPLTTCWDELKKWPSTGHNNIDAIASYDLDGRVHCIGARAFPDNALALYTDHFPIEATYEIRG